MTFIPSKKFISFLRYLNFCIPVLHSFSLCRLLLYDVISCLNKNSITHFVSYLEKEKRHDIEILSRNILMENIHHKLVPDHYLVLVNNRKQKLRARNSFKNKVFQERFIKEAFKKLAKFFFFGNSDQSLFRLRTNSEKFLY